jgi:hypothetical protein
VRREIVNEDAPQKLQLARLIWFSMLVATAIYGGVVWYVAPERGEVERFLLIPIALMAVASAAAATAFRRMARAASQAPEPDLQRRLTLDLPDGASGLAGAGA